MNANMRTHKDEDPIGIFLPAFYPLVLFFWSFGVHGKVHDPEQSPKLESPC